MENRQDDLKVSSNVIEEVYKNRDRIESGRIDGYYNDINNRIKNAINNGHFSVDVWDIPAEYHIRFCKYLENKGYLARSKNNVLFPWPEIRVKWDIKSQKIANSQSRFWKIYKYFYQRNLIPFT